MLNKNKCRSTHHLFLNPIRHLSFQNHCFLQRDEWLVTSSWFTLSDQKSEVLSRPYFLCSLYLQAAWFWSSLSLQQKTQGKFPRKTLIFLVCLLSRLSQTHRQRYGQDKASSQHQENNVLLCTGYTHPLPLCLGLLVLQEIKMVETWWD